MANSYLQTKYGFVITPFWTTRDISPLVGCIFLANGVMIWSNVTVILRLYGFADLAGKCLFATILVSFGDFGPDNCDIIVVIPRMCSSRGDMCFDFEILAVKMCSIVHRSSLSSVDCRLDQESIA